MRICSIHEASYLSMNENGGEITPASLCSPTPTLAWAILERQTRNSSCLGIQVLLFFLSSIFVQIPVVRRISVVFVLEPFGVVLELKGGIRKWAKQRYFKEDLPDLVHSYHCSCQQRFGGPSPSSSLPALPPSCPYAFSSTPRKFPGSLE